MKIKRWLNEVSKFLEYISRNSIKPEKRKEENLEKIFEIEKAKEMIDFCMNRGYTIREVTGRDKERYYKLAITKDGVKFLEEFIREEKKLKYSKWMFWSSIALVIVTVFYVFYTANLVNITKQQFEIESKPLLESLSLGEYQGFGDMYALRVINVGGTTAKINNAEIIQTFEDGFTVTLTSSVNYEILPNQEKEIVFTDVPKIFNNTNNLIFARIEINYSGEDSNLKEQYLLNRSFYEYQGIFNIYN